MRLVFGALLLGLTMTKEMLADEGMWPLNMVTEVGLQKKYDVALADGFLEHVQKSALRMSAGGSASFVSANGLVMTNHHVGAKAIHNLSTEERDLYKTGFYAETLEGELKCSNLYVDQLVSIVDVTDQIVTQQDANLSLAEREKARKAAQARISKNAQDKTGLQPQIVSLYQGARYHLYLYKRYSDVRLVMAPEKSIAFFGGDTENFEYPRHCLDVCFFRVYENDKPLQVEHYLKWSQMGPKGAEPLFVLGHPGKTDRKLTSAHAAFMRDTRMPLFLKFLAERLDCYERYAALGDEQKRRAISDIFSVRNAQKAHGAFYKGLLREPVIRKKQEDEWRLFQEVSNKPWQDIEQACIEAKKDYVAFQVLEGFGSRYCKLYAWAKVIVRAKEEKAKPNEKRLKEYSESELAALELGLFSTEPVYLDYDKVLMKDAIERMTQYLGKNHEAVKIVSAIDVDALFKETKLHDVAYRKQLYTEAAPLPDDAMIVLAKALDPLSRALREKYENEFESVLNESYDAIMKHEFKQFGETIYPDATFTLRISCGKMAGYQENGGFIAPYTTLGEAFDKARSHASNPEYAFPESWVKSEEAIDKSVPFNFVSTNDIIGGNSGSPVINSNGEIVGLIFDGNLQANLWHFAFDEKQGRAVSVHSAGILEALQKVYHAERIVQELRPQ